MKLIHEFHDSSRSNLLIEFYLMRAIIIRLSIVFARYHMLSPIEYYHLKMYRNIIFLSRQLLNLIFAISDNHHNTFLCKLMIQERFRSSFLNCPVFNLTDFILTS